MGPTFKEKVVEYDTYGSREQCTRPKKMLLLRNAQYTFLKRRL